MKKTIIRYGLFGAFSGATLFLSGILLGQELDYTIQEIVGYITIIAALTFIYFGIKHYRDRQNKGHINFGQGFAIGLGITTLVGLGIGVVDYVYTAVLNPNFADDFLEKSIDQLEAKYTGSELTQKISELNSNFEAYGDSWSMALYMFITVLIIGVAISVISALLLQTKKTSHNEL